MAFITPPDRVLETSTTIGIGTYTLAGAMTGFRPVSVAAPTDGDTAYYYAEDVDANGVPTGGFETGLGTKGAGNTLARTTIHTSSNANAAVNWAAGTRRVSLSLTGKSIQAIYSTGVDTINPVTSADGTSFGTAFGFSANGSSSAAAFGYAASANNQGVAVGYSATGYTFGVAIGYNSFGYSSGAAVGYNATAFSSGVALGYGSVGDINGTALGRNTTTNSKDAAVAIGYASKAERYRELVKCADRVAPSKQSWSMVNWYGDTTNATATEILLGGTTAQYCVLLNNSALSFSFQIIAGVTAGGTSSSWTIMGAIKRGATAASTALLGVPAVVMTGQDAGATTWVVAVAADTTNGSLKLTVTGAAATTIRWNATATLSELRF